MRVCIEEPESDDDEFTRECYEDFSSVYIHQSTVHAESDNAKFQVKLGKRTHAQSELPKGPAIDYLTRYKRFKKAEPLVSTNQSDTESSCDDFLAALEEDLESDGENPTDLPRLGRANGISTRHGVN